jgi:hypothetical protein
MDADHARRVIREVAALHGSPCRLHTWAGWRDGIADAFVFYCCFGWMWGLFRFGLIQNRICTCRHGPTADRID